MDNKPKKIFISYSKHDIEYKETLLKHLSGLRGSIVTWNDRDILPGEEWDERIKTELRQADIVLYLVSANSMATKYIQAVELPLIESRHQQGECILVPIIVDFCYWQNQPFAKHLALPEKAIPIADTKHWTNESQAWLKVIEGIEKVSHQEIKPKTPAANKPKQSYLGQYSDDVVIHAAEKDLAFAEAFKAELQKHLAAKLGGYVFAVRVQTNRDDFSQAATAIILLSEHYLAQYGDSLERLPQLQEKRLLLV